MLSKYLALAKHLAELKIIAVGIGPSELPGMVPAPKKER